MLNKPSKKWKLLIILFRIGIIVFIWRYLNLRAFALKRGNLILHVSYWTIYPIKMYRVKSLKLYIWSFRDQGVFHEAVTNQILDDLIALLKPRFIRITAKFFVRGGIFTNVIVEHRKKTETTFTRYIRSH